MPKGTQRRAKNAQPDPAPPPPVAVAVSPSPSSSDSSGAEDVSNMSELHGAAGGSHTVSASRPGSPLQVHLNADGLETDDSVTCQWEDCGKVFTHLPTLIDHIHNDHIGVHKSNYTCEWASCVRRGLPQTSRFALISHIRSHTGEKPFICPLPECDKSFTRSDALAKHMRLQHNISPPAPGRGGSRKRKRGAADDQTQGTSTPVPSVVASVPSSIPPNASAFTTFKVEPHTPSEAGVVEEANHDYFNRGKTGPSTNGRQRRLPRASQLQLQPQHTPSPDDVAQGQAQAGVPGGDEEDPDADGYLSSASDVLPPKLQAQLDETTGLVLGRTPAKVMYLFMKAKERYAVQQHEELKEQLRVAKSEMMKEKEAKEGVLDELLGRMLGPEANMLIQPPELVPYLGHGGFADPDPPIGELPVYSIPVTHQNGRGK
ncbi:hypothetical protein GALMADRAFT_158573 [Galerina marginata CBS 339.88]|uniref:C2H2-type domain-containing protein n=1 Tax=Galerina marginata (strain CBS 339.88) TaxID=685588 RepID=A0A067SPY7_GALM3|nr:hypothetical protein GALMADRAFT_158573 [Galerina marginata CBS 339.88]